MLDVVENLIALVYDRYMLQDKVFILKVHINRFNSSILLLEYWFWCVMRSMKVFVLVLDDSF